MGEARQVKDSMDSTILCLYAVHKAYKTLESKEIKKSYTFFMDYGVKKMLCNNFEHAFYINIHIARPDHLINFAIYFNTLEVGGSI